MLVMIRQFTAEIYNKILFFPNQELRFRQISAENFTDIDIYIDLINLVISFSDILLQHRNLTVHRHICL